MQKLTQIRATSLFYNNNQIVKNMKSNIKIALAVLIIAISSSFTSDKNDGFNVTYGVSAKDPSQIELRLKSDYTFTYQDYSVSSQKIEVEGIYEIKNNRILLVSEGEQIEFHSRWRIVADGAVAKSRNGLAFYTLHRKS